MQGTGAESSNYGLVLARFNVAPTLDIVTDLPSVRGAAERNAPDIGTRPRGVRRWNSESDADVQIVFASGEKPPLANQAPAR